MKKKIFWVVTLFLIVFTLSGCNGKDEERETINPLSPGSMEDTYERSKGRINEAVEEQNKNIEKALEESGLDEE